MPMFITKRRLPTEDEQRLLELRSKPDRLGCFLVLVLSAGIPAYGLSLLGELLGKLHSPEAAEWGKWAGCFAWAVLFVPLLLNYRRAATAERRLAAKDLVEGVVEEIHVSTKRVVEIGTETGNGPVLAVELESGKILYLQGYWLCEESTYGKAAMKHDPSEEFFNGLPDPYSFPSTKFTISRFPISGIQLGIEVAGAYLAPESIVEARLLEFNLGDTAILDGTLDDIAGFLERAHARRKALDS
jgi:hypothetical protein